VSKAPVQDDIINWEGVMLSTSDIFVMPLASIVTKLNHIELQKIIN